MYTLRYYFSTTGIKPRFIPVPYSTMKTLSHLPSVFDRSQRSLPTVDRQRLNGPTAQRPSGPAVQRSSGPDIMQVSKVGPCGLALTKKPPVLLTPGASVTHVPPTHWYR